ncbi:head maturation protease, ClpP-related [Cytobacillus firmus]|uniref:head maturation protease, ClpP-related n=1 Tax=Cytobacillus firmus TaxID=1399 RepID=UPI00369F5FBE
MRTVKNDFMNIKNKSSTSADLYIYGDIINNTGWKWDDSDVMPDDIKNLLDEIKDVKDLNIYINSGGGSVFAGLAIYNMLKRSMANKTVYVDGVAASIASVIALAGDKVIIPSNAFLMIHKPWTGMYGNANDFRKMAEDLDRIESGIMNVYKENMKEGVELSTIQELVDAETWLNGEEAEKYFNIEVIEATEAAACASDYFDKYNKTPNKVVEKTVEKPIELPKNAINEGEKLKFMNEIELLEL